VIADPSAAGDRGPVDLGAVGLTWQPSGQVVLAGPLQRLFGDCDRGFTVLAAACDAEPEEHPAMIDARALQAVDYLTSFPHLATFPISLEASKTNLAGFVADGPMDPTGAVRLAATAPVRQVLTPAACYHAYVHHSGETLAAPRYLTFRNTCFRREEYYEPLRRQWTFRMREIICLGTRVEVVAFLARTRAAVDALLHELDLPVSWDMATDPFFQPARNPLYLAQRLQPSKHEATFGDLAIASVNLHEDHFGAAFGITRDDRPAVSGCVAFGLERWLFALTARHGADPANWPDVTAAAGRAAAATAAAPAAGAAAGQTAEGAW
jgi:seryl-tRNA synthetase